MSNILRSSKYDVDVKDDKKSDLGALSFFAKKLNVILVRSLHYATFHGTDERATGRINKYYKSFYRF